MFEQFGEAADAARQEEVTQKLDEGKAVAADEEADAGEQLQTEESLAEPKDIEAESGEAPEIVEPELPEYETFDSFSADATVTVAGARAIVDRITGGAELTPELSAQVKQQLDNVKNLLTTKFSQEDNQDLYPDLIDLKKDLTKILVDELISSLPSSLEMQNLSGEDIDEKVNDVASKLAEVVGVDQDRIANLIAQRIKGENNVGVDESIEDEEIKTPNPDEVDSALGEIEEGEEDPDKKEKIRKIRKVMKIVGFGGVVLGETLNTVFDWEDVDLAAFLQFVMTGRMGNNVEYRNTSENGEKVVHPHSFKEKFRNYKDVGVALYHASSALAEQDGKFNSWFSVHKGELQDLEKSGNSVKTHELFMSLYQELLADSVSGSDENWKLFGNALCSSLFGTEVGIHSESISFLKEKMQNGGSSLKDFWNIGGSESKSEGSADEGEKETTTEESIPQPAETNSEATQPVTDASAT